ncbi:MAG TPA: hypothetical protein VKB12_08725 [Pyrinomonadaceae bacterium]|nr:hypothetical protein [Pyrinomonadaceae bacterium]
MRHSFVKGFDLRRLARVLTLAASLVAFSATASAQHEGHDMNKHAPQPTPTPARPAVKETPTPTPSPTPAPAQSGHDAHAGHAEGAAGGMDHSSHGKDMPGMNHAASGGDATFYSKPRVLDSLYGRSPTSFKLFLRIRPAKMSH